MKRSGCFILGMSLLLCASLALNALLFFVAIGTTASLGSMQSRSAQLPVDEQVLVEGEDGSQNKIAVIDLNGVISSGMPGELTDSMVDDIKYLLEKAVKDTHVKAIVVRIDSPGGEVTASDVLYKAIADARHIKPVVIYMGSVAASGGYYAACGGSYVMAAETTITGSIGVIIQTLNYEDLLGKVGLDAVVFKSGRLKDMLSGSREMTPEEEKYVQAMVMQTYDKFVSIVAKERKLPEAELRAGLADGRIISGIDAAAADLIDEVGYVEDAYGKARELGKAKGATVVRYAPQFRLGNLLRLMGKSPGSKMQITLASELMPKLEPGKMYFLPGHFAL